MARTETRARRFSRKASEATATATNEASLRFELEKLLELETADLGIPWLPFQLDAPLRESPRGRIRFVDVAHGAVVIEYEPPRSFRAREGAQLRHAREQAEDYARLLHAEEGRALSEYVLVAWDGAHISFGRFADSQPSWDRLREFNVGAAQLLLNFIQSDGIPLVHPQLLSRIVGPETSHGSALIPAFYKAIRRAFTEREATTKTLLLFTEWKRLFGQVVGIQSEHVKELLGRQGEVHREQYSDDPAAYLFALNTYIALVAKIVAALSLPNASQELLDASVPISPRIRELEGGQLFSAGGVANMLAGDFFSWYMDDPDWRRFSLHVEDLLTTLSGISFDLTRKSAESTRDLFKGMYQSFVPRALRHALGEYYTPDWLAAHALDQITWRPEDPLLDPTCGSGTFLLEALRRRLAEPGVSELSADQLLEGIYGIDLNPLAVLAARASIVVSIAPYLDPEDPITLPVFLADAINSAEAEGEVYKHTLQTEIGSMSFAVPRVLVEATTFFPIFQRIRELVDAGQQAVDIRRVVRSEFPDLDGLNADQEEAVSSTIATLVNLHNNGWDGIWCAILADRFAAGSIPRVSHIAGNPPWVKWSHLPREYADFIKDRCLELGVFSRDRWVGGIESDISTVITYEVIDKWLADRGRMAFFITGTVFANESSQGFRRFELQNRNLQFRIIRVEDFDEVAPFEGVSNHPTLMILQKRRRTDYPVRYRVWFPPRLSGSALREFSTAEEFRRRSIKQDLLALPVPGSDAGPWLKGTRKQQELWSEIFGPGEPVYVARKGITTDRNGIFFVKLVDRLDPGEKCRIVNDPEAGKTKGISRVRAVVECEHLFPLLRGRGVSAFSAYPDEEYHVLLPQRGMHGDPDLASNAPGVFRYLARFEDELRRRSSYKRFQKGQAYWSVWSTGPYTFSRYKVVWREMPGGRFVAAFIGEYGDPVLGRRIVVPDHKLYFVPVETEAEAAYLTAILNAGSVAAAISAYAAQLSLGVSVVEYLEVPRFEPRAPSHRRLAALAKRITARGGGPTVAEEAELDEVALAVLRAK